MRSISRVLPSVAGVLAASLIVPARPASAQIHDCQGPIVNRFAGIGGFPLSLPEPNEIESTFANIMVRFGAVCDTDQSQAPYPSNFSTAWVMVANRNGDGLKYSQAGHFRWYNSAIYPFSEFNKGSGPHRNIDYSTPLVRGSVHSFKTAYTFSQSCGAPDACLKNYVDGNVVSATDYNPISTFVRPWSPQLFGETLYNESDMPGNTGSKSHFTSIYTQRFSDDAWSTAIPGYQAQNGNGSRWGQSTTFCGGTLCSDVWTKQ